MGAAAVRLEVKKGEEATMVATDYSLRVVDFERMRTYQIEPGVMANRDVGYIKDWLKTLRPDVWAGVVVFARMVVEAEEQSEKGEVTGD